MIWRSKWDKQEAQEKDVYTCRAQGARQRKKADGTWASFRGRSTLLNTLF